MSSFILTVRPQPDADLDVACLARRGVAALASPVMAPSYLGPVDLPLPATTGGLIFTSRHAISGFLDLLGGAAPPEWRHVPVFAVGRASGRVARAAGFADVSIGAGGGAGLAPLVLSQRRRITLPLLWPCAVQRGFDMVAALAPDMHVTAMPVYDMAPVARLGDETVTALTNGTVAGVILMSARSARLFRDQLRFHGLEACVSGLALIAGSAPIAEAAGPGWQQNYIARRPTRARLLAIACLFYHRVAARRQPTDAAAGKGLTTE